MTDSGSLLSQASIHVHRSFDAAEKEWRAAEGVLAHYGFQLFDWLASWQETIGQARGISPLIVVVAGVDGLPSLILPLGLERQRRLTTLIFLGAPVTDYRGPLISREFDATDFATLWRRILAVLPRVDIIRFDRMPEAVEGVLNPLVRLPGARRTETSWSATVPSSMEEFQSTRRRRLFKDNRRQRRQLSEVAPSHFELARTQATMAEVLAVMKAEKSRRWLETGNPDGFADPAMGAFYDLASRRMPGVVHGSLLRVGDLSVAAHWGMEYRGRFFYLMPASKVGPWGRYSPGRLLLEKLIEWAIEARFSVFDLTVGDEAYKKNWADILMPLWSLRQGVSLSGRLVVAGEAAWISLRRRAKNIAWLRRAVRRLRNQ